MIFVVFPLLLAAVIKNAEKIYALRLGSIGGFRGSVQYPPNAGCDYSYFMDMYVKRKYELCDISREDIKLECGIKEDVELKSNADEILNWKIPDSQAFKTFFKEAEAIEAYKAVEVQLGMFSAKQDVIRLYGLPLAFLSLSIASWCWTNPVPGHMRREIHPSKVNGDKCKSVLFEGCILAKSLQSLERKEEWSRDKKWEMISAFWVETLFCSR
ncbi:hypothetical protein TSUD_36920 [Trifolium subterraneum]|uniref:DUF4220 domain-containing protein n=1 Tax=Trifolium subterraneum TaxID=3900 RepID=A0A2Z6M4Q0_TRISU|nr:hypothetical protein TSUD_36920 [Trifolium subterraneum]